MATEKSDDETIPTLVDVIVPGKTEVKDNLQQSSDLPAHSSASLKGTKSQALSKASLNAKIEALVAEILIRHMDEARKEIIHRALSEIDSYMDNVSEKP